MSPDMRRRRLIVIIVATCLTSSCAGLYDLHPAVGFFLGLFAGFAAVVGYDRYDRWRP